MKKSIISGLCLLFLIYVAPNVFAGGAQQSGRDMGQDSIEGGQFAGAQSVDAYAFINDYDFPFETNTNEDLSVFVRLENERALTIGSNLNLFVGLRVNERDFFERNEGNYIVFIHNPEILLREDWEKSFADVLGRIFLSMQSDAVFGIFNPFADEIMVIQNINSIQNILNEIKQTRKVFNSSNILEQSFRFMEAIDNDLNTRFLWVTDSDLLRGSTSESDIQYFNFLMRLQSQNRISFSYLGYGEVPNWTTMNNALRNVGGNTYYINSPAELEDIIWEDFEKYIHPTISNIRMNLTIYPWVTEARFDYRSEWYPLVNFRPTTDFYTHTRSNEILNMDFDDHRIYQYYLRLGAISATEANVFFRDTVKDGNIPIGFVTVQYYSFNEGRTIYRSYPLVVRYTEDYDEYALHFNHEVRKFTILQNTAFILNELSQLINRRDYFTAILLVNSQINLLEAFLQEEYDEMIEKDIESLRLNRNLLMDQARSLNLIR